MTTTNHPLYDGQPKDSFFSRERFPEWSATEWGSWCPGIFAIEGPEDATTLRAAVAFVGHFYDGYGKMSDLLHVRERITKDEPGLWKIDLR